MKTVRLNDIFTTAKADLVPLIQAICTSDAKKSYQTPEALKVLYMIMIFIFRLQWCIGVLSFSIFCSKWQIQLMKYRISDWRYCMKTTAGKWILNRNKSLIIDYYSMTYTNTSCTSSGWTWMEYWRTKSLMCGNSWESWLRLYQVCYLSNQCAFYSLLFIWCQLSWIWKYYCGLLRRKIIYETVFCI